MAARVNRGRQRIPLQKTENETYRLVTFSKRKSSILKKSSELCTLTGAEMVIIIRSPGNKTFSFGYPCVHAILDHYLSMYPEPLANIYIMQQFLENFPNIEPRSLNVEYTVVNEGLLFYRQQSEVLTKIERVAEAEQQYKRSLGIMNNEDLNSFERDLIKLHGIVAQRSQELQQRQVELMQHNNTMGAVGGFHQFLPPNAAIGGPFHEGNSSSNDPIRSIAASSSSFSWRAI